MAPTWPKSAPAWPEWARPSSSAAGARLRRTLAGAPHAARAHPTSKHFWPPLVAAGAAPPAADWQLIDGGVAHGMLSMDTFVSGAVA